MKGQNHYRFSPNDTLDVNFSYKLNNEETERAFIYGYTTSGSIIEDGETFSEIYEEEGSSLRKWEAGSESQEAQLFFVFENGAGGVDFWYSEAIVQ